MARGVQALKRSDGFTLIEVLLTVVVLGIAGALVIPAMTQTGVLRVQAAVRTLVADITYVQADAIAFQSRRAIWFGKVPRWDSDAGAWTYVDGNGYVAAEVNGPTLDLTVNAMVNPDARATPLARDFDLGQFGGARLQTAQFNDTSVLIFDELGGPVEDLTGPSPGAGGSVEILSPDASFVITVSPLTGRVGVTRAD